MRKLELATLGFRIKHLNLLSHGGVLFLIYPGRLQPLQFLISIPVVNNFCKWYRFIYKKKHLENVGTRALERNLSSEKNSFYFQIGSGSEKMDQIQKNDYIKALSKAPQKIF